MEGVRKKINVLPLALAVAFSLGSFLDLDLSWAWVRSVLRLRCVVRLIPSCPCVLSFADTTYSTGTEVLL